MIIQKIKSIASENASEMIEVRRHLHMYPELSFKEENTIRYIKQKLNEWGIPFSKDWKGIGITGVIEGGKRGKTIGLRADIDALPIQETNSCSYSSKVEGVMHACGHDVHTTCLLSCLRIIHALKSELHGQVKFIFQPGEEKLPGGASIMIKEGVLENPAIQSIFGQHVHPPLSAGKVGFRAGKYMASADEIYVRVYGKGGHAALPHNVIDPIMVSSQLLIQLQQIVSRYANPVSPSVLSFGKIASVGGTTNVIPDEVEIEGTFRAMDENWREEAHALMKRMAKGIAESMGARCDFEIRKGYPFLKNDTHLTEIAKLKAVEYLGSENVVDLDLRMSAEDFAYYSQQVPACFYRLGTSNADKGITSPVHTSTFDIDESALETGGGLMAYLCLASK